MSRLAWDQGSRLFEQGVSHGVLYLPDSVVPWNGLVSVNEEASGEQDTSNYIDGRRLVISQQEGDFSASVEAYTYPEGLEEASGFGDIQTHLRFGFSYRVQGSDGDKIHLVYNALLKQPNRAWSTMQENVSPSLFQWDLLASSVNIPGARPSSHLIIDLALTEPSLITQIEDWLYGTDEDDPRLPDPEEFVDLFEAATSLKITYNPDGTWTAEGPDNIVEILPDGEFRISAPTALLIELGVFQVKSF